MPFITCSSNVRPHYWLNYRVLPSRRNRPMCRLRGVLMSPRLVIISRALIWPHLGWKLTPIVMLSKSESKTFIISLIVNSCIFFSRLKCEKNKIRFFGLIWWELFLIVSEDLLFFSFEKIFSLLKLFVLWKSWTYLFMRFTSDD